MEYTLIKTELAGLYQDHLAMIDAINRNYLIYEGQHHWTTPDGLDYVPTKKITNLIQKLIDTKARFIFGKQLYFDFKPEVPDQKGSTVKQDEAAEKERLFERILQENKFHSKILKAYKDCLIGSKVAIKLWSHENEGLKIIFTPAQEFIAFYNEDDIDLLEKIIFVYNMNDETKPENQRIRKQTWSMAGGKCKLDEGIYSGKGALIEEVYKDHTTGLDFIPVIIIKNGGLTGATEGYSIIDGLWDNQDSYNKLTSDDIDALKFQMFGQDVVTDADENSLKSMKIAPKALIDLQTDITADGRQAKMERLESHFSYKDKFADTIGRIKNDLYDIADVPNVSLEQLQGLVQSGKSMKALYWGIIAATEEEWTEWGPALEQMVEFIFKEVEAYNLYKSKHIAQIETRLEIHHYYPIPEDELAAREADMNEVIAEVRSRKSYMKKWGEFEDPDAEIEQIQFEKQLLQDSYTQNLTQDME